MESTSISSPIQASLPMSPEIGKHNSEGIKVISRKKIKIKQTSDLKNISKKSMSEPPAKTAHTERRQTPERKNWNHETEAFSLKNNCESCAMNEEFIVLLQKEIKRLQNITNDLSYQLIMNDLTPVIKESERTPIDLSINPLRRREQKSRLCENKYIPSKALSRSKTNDNWENTSNTSTQADVIRPSSGFRIRDQNGNSKYTELDTSVQPDSPVDIGPSKAEKYNKEKDFVKKIEKDSIKVISGLNINYKSSIKKLPSHTKINKTGKKNVMLPPLEKEEKGTEG